MADIVRVRADIKKRLVDEEWRAQFLTTAIIKSAIDDLDAKDALTIKRDLLRRSDRDLGRLIRRKVDEKLSDVADAQIDAALADGALSLDEYERLI